MNRDFDRINFPFTENPFACIDLLIRSKREDREIWGFCDIYLILVALADFCFVAEPLGFPLLSLTVSGTTVPLRKRVLLAWSDNPLSVSLSESGESGLLVDMHKPTCSPSWVTGHLQLRILGPALEMHRFPVSCCTLLQTSPTWAWWTGCITVFENPGTKGPLCVENNYLPPPAQLIC